VLLRRGLDPEVVPAASTVTGILRRFGLLGAVKEPRSYVRFEHDSPNQLWQMDFKGWIPTSTGRAEPFDILDDHSRFNLCLQLADQSELTIRRLLHSTFSRYGLPDRILCDNGPPWGNNQPGHRWTGLGVWLLDLGIGVSHSRPYHPQTLGKDERFHRTLDLEVISTRARWDNPQQLQRAFDQWRTIYNHHRPHDALGGAVPADRYQPSPRTLPTRIDPPEYPDGYHIRKVSTNSQISFAGKIIRIGTAFTRQPVGIVPTTTDGTYQIYYRHQLIRTVTIT
jgi:transposase InsO family protein